MTETHYDYSFPLYWSDFRAETAKKFCQRSLDDMEQAKFQVLWEEGWAVSAVVEFHG